MLKRCLLCLSSLRVFGHIQRGHILNSQKVLTHTFASNHTPQARGLHLPVALIIMDGCGLDKASKRNAVSLAHTPNLDTYWKTCPHMELQASGTAVGLPEGQIGNSEVGHLNIGAGRVLCQELTRINDACKDQSIFSNEVLCKAMDHAQKPGAVLHIMGLVSPGGVHASQAHLYALIKMACMRHVPEVYIHCFTDGRDVPPESAKDFIAQLQKDIDAHTCDTTHIHIASVAGRYYAMDRDNRWNRVQKAYDAIAHCTPHSDCSIEDYIQSSYDKKTTDEFLVPTSFVDRGVEDQDAVIFFNFRPDRARELTHAFTDATFDSFDRGSAPHPYFVCFTEYDAKIHADVAFPKIYPDEVLADVLAEHQLRQFHIAETEKYAHVTFFFNGGREAPKDGEIRKLIPSPKVATYDLQPEMSAHEVCDALVHAIDTATADFYLVNFANCDMVGHTGSIPATIKAVETVDACVGRVVDAMKRAGGTTLVTADHGNADCMVLPDGEPMTSHTTRPVPLILATRDGRDLQFNQDMGALCNIAPTILDIMGIQKPDQMTADSLIRHEK